MDELILYKSGISPAFVLKKPWYKLMDVTKYIPQNKYDHETMVTLSRVHVLECKPVFMELLVWIQDINWPIARDMVHLLAKAGDEILPEILQILRSTDEVWKYNCIAFLIPELPLSCREKLHDDLWRMALHPTSEESREEVDVVAREALHL